MILNYLRHGSLHITFHDSAWIDFLLADAQYMDIESLVNELMTMRLQCTHGNHLRDIAQELQNLTKSVATKGTSGRGPHGVAATRRARCDELFVVRRLGGQDEAYVRRLRSQRVVDDERFVLGELHRDDRPLHRFQKERQILGGKGSQ